MKKLHLKMAQFFCSYRNGTGSKQSLTWIETKMDFNAYAAANEDGGTSCLTSIWCTVGMQK